jgi:ABC-2 type transport system ATP-binding protein
LTVYGLEKKHISDLLKKLKIENVYKQYASKLSNGEKQRLNILLTLMHNPTYLFFDELTTGLDALSRESITDFLVEKKQKGKTIVLVSHYFFEIWKLCDYVLMLKDGNNIFYGDKFEIANNEIDFEKKCKELLFKGRI